MEKGVWKMADDGTFELREPYRTRLKEAKEVATLAWHKALIEYLEPLCPYTAGELSAELVRRNTTRDEAKMDILDEFVVEALAGDL